MQSLEAQQPVYCVFLLYPTGGVSETLYGSTMKSHFDRMIKSLYEAV